jgi:hypothetical protein
MCAGVPWSPHVARSVRAVDVIKVINEAVAIFEISRVE